MSYNYTACALEPGSCNYWVYMPQQLKLEKPLQWEACVPQLSEQKQSSPYSLELEQYSEQFFFF